MKVRIVDVDSIGGLVERENATDAKPNEDSLRYFPLLVIEFVSQLGSYPLAQDPLELPPFSEHSL